MSTARTPVWETTYAHDRRKHRHRCCFAGCNRIIEAGEHVVMCRVVGRKTRAAHADCAAKPHDNEGRWTLRDAMAAWGTDYLRACGWRIEQHPMSMVPGIASAERRP